MAQKLLVLKKLEDWIVLVQPCLRNFPKAARFTLANRIEQASLDCLDEVIQANLDKSRRKDHIFKARVSAERIQFLVRVAKAQSFMDLRHYELYCEKLIEISKMLAGWARVTN